MAGPLKLKLKLKLRPRAAAAAAPPDDSEPVRARRPPPLPGRWNPPPRGPDPPPPPPPQEEEEEESQTASAETEDLCDDGGAGEAGTSTGSEGDGSEGEEDGDDAFTVEAVERARERARERAAARMTSRQKAMTTGTADPLGLQGFNIDTAGLGKGKQGKRKVKKAISEEQLLRKEEQKEERRKALRRQKVKAQEDVIAKIRSGQGAAQKRDLKLRERADERAAKRVMGGALGPGMVRYSVHGARGPRVTRGVGVGPLAAAQAPRPYPGPRLQVPLEGAERHQRALAGVRLGEAVAVEVRAGRAVCTSAGGEALGSFAKAVLDAHGAAAAAWTVKSIRRPPSGPVSVVLAAAAR